MAKTLTAKLMIEPRLRRNNSPNIKLQAFNGAVPGGDMASMLGELGFYHLLVCGNQIYILLDEVDQIPMRDQELLRFMMDEMDICRLIVTTNNFAGIDGSIRNRSDCIEMKMPAPSDWLVRTVYPALRRRHSG